MDPQKEIDKLIVQIRRQGFEAGYRKGWVDGSKSWVEMIRDYCDDPDWYEVHQPPDKIPDENDTKKVSKVQVFKPVSYGMGIAFPVLNPGEHFDFLESDADILLIRGENGNPDIQWTRQ